MPETSNSNEQSTEEMPLPPATQQPTEAYGQQQPQPQLPTEAYGQQQPQPQPQQPWQAPEGSPTPPENWSPANPQQMPVDQQANWTPWDQQTGTGNGYQQVPPQGSQQQGPPTQNPLFQSMQMFSTMSQQDAIEFASARRFITIAQVTALVSLLFGGVILSGASIIIAIIGYRRLSRIAANYSNEPALQGLIRRPGALAVIMSVFALALNIISLIAVYPLIVEALQNGDLSTLFQSSSSQLSTTPSPAPPASPGDSLFG